MAHPAPETPRQSRWQPFPAVKGRSYTPVERGQGWLRRVSRCDCVLGTVIQSRQRAQKLVYSNGCWMSHKPLKVRQLSWS